MNSQPLPIPPCDLLIFVATSSEKDQLEQAAKEAGLPFTRRLGRLGYYYDLGRVGTNRVLAVRTAMGPFSERGSAARAIHYLAETQATGLISLGMAFGADPGRQRIGQVLVSTGVLTYDYRIVRADSAGMPIVDYSDVERYPSKASLLAMFQAAAGQTEWRDKVHVGLMLSGGARIHCGRFRDELVQECGAGRPDPIIGGDMEGMGFVSTSPKEDPRWILVKGISDFADEDRDNVITTGRPIACYNSARFVLAALLLTVGS